MATTAAPPPTDWFDQNAPPPAPGAGASPDWFDQHSSARTYTSAPPPQTQGIAAPEPISAAPDITAALTGPNTYAANAPKPQLFDPWDLVLPGAHETYQALTGPGADKPMVDVSALHPENLAPVLQKRYPVLNYVPQSTIKGALEGAGQAVSALTTPKSAALLAGGALTGGAAEIPGAIGTAAKIASQITGAVFSYQMLRDAYNAIPQFRDRLHANDGEGAARVLTGAVVNGTLGALSAAHAATGVFAAEPLEQYQAGQSTVPPSEPEVLGGPPPPYKPKPKAPPQEAEFEPQKTPAQQTLERLAQDHPMEHLVHSMQTMPGFTEAIVAGDHAKVAEMLKPSQTETISPATPNPPSAALPTQPESPETIAIQIGQLGDGVRRVVMFPKGQGQPVNAPTGAPIGLTRDEFGNTYFYRTDLIKKSAIHKAAKNNELSEVIGSTEGTGAPDKSELPPDAPVVVVHAPDGTEVQATATTPEAMPETIAAHQPLVPPGGNVTVETPAQVVTERQPELQAVNAPTAVNEPQLEPGQVGTSQSFPEFPRVSQSFPEGGERFRGAWNIPIDEQGQRQAADLGQSVSGQITDMVTGPHLRHQQTMAEISATNPQAPVRTSDAFAPSDLGMFEGQFVTPESIAALNDRFKNHFNEPIPGVGQYSGKPGEIPAVWTKRLIDGLIHEIDTWQPGERKLIVTSGRDVQAIRAWAAAGMPLDGHVDIGTLISKWKTDPAGMLYLDPLTNEIKDVKDAQEPGIYIARHARTAANGPEFAAEPVAGPQTVTRTEPNKPELTRTPSGIAEPEPIRLTAPTPVEKPTNQVVEPEAIGLTTRAKPKPAPPALKEAVEAVEPDAIKRFMASEEGTFTPGPLLRPVRAVLETGSKILDETRQLLAPQTRGEEAQEAAGSFRQLGGERMLRQDRAKALFEQFRNHFYTMPAEHGVHGLNVIDDIEHGSTQGLDTKSRDFADAAEEAYADRGRQLVDRKLVKEKSLIENYFTHQYKNPDAAKQFIESWLQKRPMAGAEGFRRKRIFPTLREAIDAGLEPKYDNPVDYVLAGLAAMDKSITAHDVFNEWKKVGYLKFVRDEEKLPPGWGYINDQIFTVRGPRQGAVGLPPGAGIEPEKVTVYGRREMGKYAAPEGMAQVANNWLSPNLHKYTAYQLWMNTKGILNMMQLGFSWFHGLTTTINSSVSDISLGLEQLSKGNLRGAKSVFNGSVPFLSVIQDAIRGTRLNAVWNGTADNVTPLEAATVEGLKYAGGSPNQQQFDPDMFLKGLKKAIAQRKIVGTAARALNPLLHAEQIMKPIMQKLVPRAKLAAFEKMMINIVNEHPDMDQDEARQRFGKAWDSIDNRFGQLNQNNMLMNGIVRDLMNIIVGRPGWTIGTIRELAPGLTFDLAKNVHDVWEGKKPEMSHRTGYVMAVLFYSALINGLLTYLFTGDRPKGMDYSMDYIAFRDGGITESGTPSRQILPTYVAKDMYSWLTDWKKTAVAKLSQPLQVARDLLFRNRDFYNHKITGEGGMGLGRYALQQVTPYSIQGILRNLERQQPFKKTILPLVGVMPGTRQMSMTAAQKILSDYNEEHEEQTRALPTEHSRAMSKLYVTAKKSPDKLQEEGQKFVEQGLITPRDLSHVVRRGQVGALASELESVKDVNVVLRAYEAATPEERKHVDREARRKVALARQRPWEWSEQSRRLAKQFFSMEPVRVANPTAISAR